MKVKLSHKKALNIANVLGNFAKPGEKEEAVFVHAVTKNLNLLECEIKAIQKARETIKPYDDARIAMLKELANKDKKGNPVIKNGIVDIPDDRQENVGVRIVELQEKYKKELQDYDKFMEREEVFELVEIPLDTMPKMDRPTMTALLPLVK